MCRPKDRPDYTIARQSGGEAEWALERQSIESMVWVQKIFIDSAGKLTPIVQKLGKQTSTSIVLLPF